MMILLVWIIALLGFLKVAASLLRRGQERRDRAGLIPEDEVLINHCFLKVVASLFLYEFVFPQGSKESPDGGIVAGTSNLDMQPLGVSDINHVCEICASTNPSIYI